MGKRTSRVAIPKDVRKMGGWYAALAMWHLNDALVDSRDLERPPLRRLPDEVVRDEREARDQRIIAEAREAHARLAARFARSSAGE